MSFLHNMSENQRTVEEFANLTDWQIVNLYFKPASKIADDRQARLEGKQKAGLGDVSATLNQKDEKGRPKPPALAWLVSMYRGMGIGEEAAVRGAKEQIAAFKRQHGIE